MSSLRPFEPDDLFKFNLTNLDTLTENYDLHFYFTYLAKWPSLFNVVEGPKGEINAYSKCRSTNSYSHRTPELTPSIVMGKMESSPEMYQHSEHYLPWHAHITALTVAPPSRRLGFARLLTESLERAGGEYNAWFVDLFVRKSNKVATDMYRGMGQVTPPISHSE